MECLKNREILSNQRPYKEIKEENNLNIKINTDDKIYENDMNLIAKRKRQLLEMDYENQDSYSSFQFILSPPLESDDY